MSVKTINITDNLSKKNTELVSEMVADVLTDLGITIDEDPVVPLVYSWNIKVDYEVTK
jgi:hypothetical protein